VEQVEPEKKFQILLVDDDPLISDLFALELAAKDIELHYLQEGKKCIEYINDHPLDLVLLDSEMPGVKGLDILKEIRNTYKPVEFPVIMVTANEDSQSIVNALRNGANDYVTKPINFDIAEARIRTQLRSSQFYKKSLKANQLEAVNAMIATYNHEINNPLAIALGCLELKMPDSQIMLKKSLFRIRDILIEIKKLQDEELEIVDYSSRSKMINIKKT